MTRSKGDTMSPRCQVVLMMVLLLIAYSYAGPVGPLPNVTSADMGLKQGSCALGDVVYLPGDEFPGSSPCERCTCTERGVHCAQQQCEPRPGCKALHRPDHCCPTYQCECEQEGRVYGNGEKLVDPADPCRVCYCQGGEVVCRRIACFTRDDCTPRLVPGRCCPEYDNCPLRGVTSLPIMTSSVPVPTAELIESSDAPVVPKEVVKQEITIKEITPVSEIPIITDVKIKEILPSPTMDVAEYSSSKSPLIPREATSEKPSKADVEPTIHEPDVASPSVIEIHPSPETASPEVIKHTEENKAVDDAPPSKISLSTQDSINSEIYPSNVHIVATVSSSAASDVQSVARTTKAPMIEEEDPLLFDHNPAFPPLPDDLSVLSNHGDELVPEPSVDTEHVPDMTLETAPVPEVIVASISAATDTVANEQLTTATPKYLPDTSVTTEEPFETSSHSETLKVETTSSQSSVSKEFPVINLRSAIPTEIVSSSSQAVTSTSQGTADTSTLAQNSPAVTTENTEVITTKKIHAQSTESKIEITTEKIDLTSTHLPAETEYTTSQNKETEIFITEISSNTPQEQTTSSIAKSNVPTEVTSQTELSSLPIETSDQKPHDAAENISKDTLDLLTVNPLTTFDKISPSSAEVITVTKSTNTGSMENIETTEFILNAFGLSESATDTVELIKIAGDRNEPEDHAAIIDNTDRNKNALSDLFKLVSDVASISDHTDASAPTPAHPAAAPSISESEELIPVNAGYKSKTNYNQNSITEVPVKNKNVTPLVKQKVVEIEDDDSGSITDSPPPNDKVEPTTRRPIIDNVSDDKPEKKTDKKDIEIITKSYVPTIHRRPTKVVLQQEKPQEDEPAASVETGTESSEAVTPASQELTSSAEDHGTESTLSLEQ